MIHIKTHCFVAFDKLRLDRFKNGSVERLKLGLGILIGCLSMGFASFDASADEPSAATAEETIDFSRDVLPILSNNCFQCHGPDEAHREGGLRLDQKDGAFAQLDSGAVGIVSGDLGKSEVWLRIQSDDADMRMPPSDSEKELSAADKQLLRRWIESGASWSEHWAFVAPRRPDVPSPTHDWSSENAIDRFIHRRLEQEGLSPAQRAEKTTLIRRVTLDLTGLPPTVDEVDAYLSDSSPNAYLRVVNRLLDSPKYGEHMGRLWLDAARYADTHGLHLDNERSMWPYREWVIAAFNRNMPFDQFTIEQLAGDLLDDPTLEQRIATGFNRCNVTTSEGGSIDDEYYVRYAVDRVETTATVWLGLTAGCAACHDHKFDPLTQREFYQLFSYFFSLTEKAMDGNALLPPPAVKAPSRVQQVELSKLKDGLAEANQRRERLVKSILEDGLVSEDSSYELPDSIDAMLSGVRRRLIWIDDQVPQGAKTTGDGSTPWHFVSSSDYPVRSGRRALRRSAEGLSQDVLTEVDPGIQINAFDRLFAYVYLDPEDPPKTIQLQFHSGDWEHRVYWGEDKGHGAGKKGAANFHAGPLPSSGEWVKLEVPAGAVGLAAENVVDGWAFTQFDGTVIWDEAGIERLPGLSDEARRNQQAWEQFRAEVQYPKLPEDVQKALDVAPSERDQGMKESLRQHFVLHVHPESKARLAPVLAEIASYKERLGAVNKAIPSTLVMEDRKDPRQAHILERGEYDRPTEPVSSSVPSWIAPLPENAPKNRLGLARWLVDPTNPLPARVAVNRFWQQMFGVGISKTAEDFGLQGERPEHPELLDWLSVEFIESGWDVKHMLRLMVSSATYQQASRVSGELLAQDPENRLLARGPRHRLDAEVIRDQALALSGLLVDRIGGKSVKPYQPEGLWKPVGFGGSNTSVFKQDHGDALFRRSMYTFWKRTSPPPSMATFDAPDRETCKVRRARTNTPLQSLVLMNDVQFLETARRFATRVIRRSDDDSSRLVYAFRAATARTPTSAEAKHLVEMLSEARRDFTSDPKAAAEFVSVGESYRDESIEPTEHAAWTLVTHLLLNLHETISKE